MSRLSSPENCHDTILALLRDFCTARLTGEYFDLAGRMMLRIKDVNEKLLEKGKPESWAAGIIMALGYVNFLFDKSNAHYVPAKEIVAHFGVSVSNAGLRARQIRDCLDVDRFDPEFTTAAMKERDPFAQFVVVNDTMYPLSALPAELQQLVREARARGEEIEFSISKEKDAGED